MKKLFLLMVLLLTTTISHASIEIFNRSHQGCVNAILSYSEKFTPKIDMTSPQIVALASKNKYHMRFSRLWNNQASYYNLSMFCSEKRDRLNSFGNECVNRMSGWVDKIREKGAYADMLNILNGCTWVKTLRAYNCIENNLINTPGAISLYQLARGCGKK